MERKQEETWIKRLTRWQERLGGMLLSATSPLAVAWLPGPAPSGGARPRGAETEPGNGPAPAREASCLDALRDARFELPPPDGPWRPIAIGEAWGRAWETAWFRVQGSVPREWAGRPVVAHLDFGSEGLVLDPDGRLLTGITTGSIWEPAFKRDRVPLFDACRGGERVELLIEATAASLFGVFTEFDPAADAPHRYGRYEGELRFARLAAFQPELWHLWLDLKCLLGLIRRLPEKSVRRARLIRAGSLAADRFAGLEERAVDARAILAAELYRPAEPSALGVTAVGHAHIDTAWLWPVEETVRKCARTFASQVSLLDRYPGYVFGASQAQHYIFVRERHPELYQRIRELVAEGRWEVQGGMWVEPDCNLIDGESMVRQLLHGLCFFREEFGVDVDNLWLPDVFGYSAALPQILRRSGIDSFLTQKMSWNQWNDFPHTSFVWRGLDGSEVLAHFPPENTYNSPLDPEAIIPGGENFREKGFLDEFLCLFGVGDGGGGPKEEHLETGRRMHDLEGAPRVVFGRADGFFARLRARRDDLPVWVGELYLELHRGSLTSQARVKQGNRRLEQALRIVELLWSMRPIEEYPAAALDRLWKLTLLHQFHDILPGSSIHRAYDRTHADHEAALAECSRLIEEAGRCLLTVEAGAVTLFHPHDDPFDGVVELGTVAPGGWFDASSGRRVPLQEEEGRSVARVRIEPYSFLSLRPDGRGRGVDGTDSRSARCRWIAVDPAAGPIEIENERVRYEFDHDGRLLRGWDKEAGREIMAEGEVGNRLTLYEDRPNDWDAWDVDLFYERAVVDTACAVRLERLVVGVSGACAPPVRQALRFHLAVGASSITQEVRLATGSCRLDFVTEVDWQERHRMLRVSFPVAVRAAEATFEIQYGHLRRPTHRNTSWDQARFEVVAHRWVDLTSGEYGVALLNDSKYGHRVHNHDLDLNLLRGATYPDPDCDLGRHRFTYALLPHAASLVSSDVQAEAAVLNAAPVRFEGRSVRTAPECCRVTGEGLRLAVVKRAEDGDGWIFRLVESRGRALTGVLRLPRPDGRLQLTDLMERNLLADPESVSGEFPVALGPFEIRTYRWRAQ